MLNTANPYSYLFKTKELEIYILGGIGTDELDTPPAALAIQKTKSSYTLR